MQKSSKSAAGSQRGGVKNRKSNRSSSKASMIALVVVLVAAVCVIVAYFAPSLFFPAYTGDRKIGEIQSDNTPILITEVMSDNSSVIQDSYSYFSDWLEVTNVSTSDINMNGWKIARDTNTTNYFEFPDYVLKSGERVLIYCTNKLENTAGMEFHAPFKLSSAGCMLVLYNSDDTVMQSFRVPDLRTNTSYAYINGSFTVCEEPTPGSENTHENYLATRSSRKIVSGPVIMTELMAKNMSYCPDENGEYLDWIEIYNTTSQTVSLYNYALSDNEDNLRKWIFPNISIGPGQYMIIYCSGYDRTDPAGKLHTNFRLSTENEGAILTDAQGNIIDYVQYDLLKADQSYTRLSDGSWVTYKAPTPGAANTSSSAALISGQFAAQNSSGVFINEVMASSTQAIGKNASYDWVEMRNNTAQSVDLGNYGLSDDPAKPRKWQFPEGTTIAPGGYLPIYLSGLGTENSKIGNYLHTNFSLSATDCETLVFSDPEGHILDRCPLGMQYADISYGRMGTSTDSGFYYLTASTPATLNVGTGYSERMVAPTFSIEGGLYAAGETLTLTLKSEPGATIYYTLDASEPSASEVGGHSYQVDPEYAGTYSGEVRTYQYNGPITINKTTVVRAIASKNDQLSSPVATQTYFMGVSHTLQVVSLVMDPEDLWGYTTGLYVKGPNATGTYPYGSTNRGANFWMSWEKAANVELFSVGGEPILSQGCGVRLHGQYSRAESGQKSFKVIAGAKYGVSRFNAKLFPNRDYTEYKSFLLRQTGQDTKYARMRDSILSTMAADINELSQQKVAAMGETTYPLMYQDTALAILYINGEYWGHYNLRERVNAYSICQWQGWDVNSRGNIDLLKAHDTVLQGSAATRTEFYNWYTKNGIDTDEELAYAEQYIDVWNYLDYCAIQFYTGNTDVLNVKKYRNSSQENGSQWRMVLFDLDWAFYTNTNSVNRWFNINARKDYPNFKYDTSLFVALMKNSKCKDYFLSTIAELIDGPWSGESILAKIQKRYTELEPEINQHLARWGGSRTDFDAQVKKFASFAQTRPGRILYFFYNSRGKYITNEEFEHYFGDLTNRIDMLDDNGKVFKRK